MKTGDFIKLSGCVTQDKYLLGRSLREIERILGFHVGRLSQGMIVVAFTELPGTDDFELQGYSQVASHRFKNTSGLDVGKLSQMARSRWTLSGPNRLVKVLPAIRHNQNIEPDKQYPPGLGVPQWVIKKEMSARVVSCIQQYPDGKYMLV